MDPILAFSKNPGALATLFTESRVKEFIEHFPPPSMELGMPFFYLCQKISAYQAAKENFYRDRSNDESK